MSEVLKANQAPPLGTVLGAGYELLRFLGAGGMGAVYEAAAPDGRRVAVKVLLETALTAAGGQIVERFKREANVASTLDSPHIVPAIDAGMDERLNIPFMVMPLLVGSDLEELIERIGPIHPAVVARIIRQACRALAGAHEHGVIHRDIKPANIFLDQDRSGRVTVRVLDFGIAKWRTQDTGITKTGSTLGTPHYMSPEQCQSTKNVSVGTDVWSLGVTMYQALCGHVPFAEAQTLGNLYVSIMTRDAPLLQNRAPWIEPGLASLVHGTMLRDPATRCPSMLELSAALEAFTAGDDDINAFMLEPLQPEMQSYQASRTQLPEQWVSNVRPPAAMALDMTEAIADPLLGHNIANYTLLRCLGRGGMGAVYEGQAPSGDRFAVKVINPGGTGKADVLRRFVREARATMTIESGNVVKVVEADTDQQQQLPYIVMEMLHGWDLGAVLQRHGAMPAQTVARMFVQACRGINAAHTHGFVHRDIKPANMFMHELPSGEIVVKICDFGIVKRVEQDKNTVALTRTGGVVGSPLFMSPEQSKNSRDIDLRTDVWSLGVSLFQALTGTHPWQGRETVGELIVAICTEELPHVQDRAPWVPPELAAVVHKAMARDPAHRFQSMDELEGALQRFTGGAVTLHRDDVQPVGQQDRSQVAERSDGHAASAHTAGSMAQTVGELPTQGIGKGAIGIAAAVVVAGAAGLFFAFGGDSVASETGAALSAEPPVTASAEDSAAVPAEAVKHDVEVEVLPKSAKVTVDGKEQKLEDGKLELSGEAGAEFEVKIEDGDRKLEKTIVITGSGKARPDKLELEEVKKPPVGGGPLPKPPPPPPPKPPPVAKPPVKPPPVKPAATMKPVDDWVE